MFSRGHVRCHLGCALVLLFVNEGFRQAISLECQQDHGLQAKAAL